MNTETATKLVNQTFVESLHVQQGMAKKEFVELKKINYDRQNQERLQRKSEKEKKKDNHMVFNYLWHYFPEAMALNTAHKNLGPENIPLVIGDSEFKKILKSAKRFHWFCVSAYSVPFIFFTILTVYSFTLGSGFGFLFSIFAMISGIFLVLLSNPEPTQGTICRQKRLQELCQIHKKNER